MMNRTGKNSSTKVMKNTAIVDKALAFIQSITEDELDFIANADYGVHANRHKDALRTLIFEQNGVVQDKQQLYPYEVVELARWRCQTGHEREFAICNIIVALSILAGEDCTNDPDYMLQKLASEYEKLTPELSKFVTDLLRLADS